MGCSVSQRLLALTNKKDEATHKHKPLVQLLRVRAKPIPHEGSAQVPPRNLDS